MKTIQKAAFPLLLVLAACAVHFWQHALASLPYLPLNGVAPLAVLTPSLLILTFFATFVMLKQTRTPKPVLRSVLSTAAMLALILCAGVYFLSYVSYRFAGVIPVLVLPDWPTGIVSMIITAGCIVHLTGLLVCAFIKRKTQPKRAFPIAAGWLLLNACLFLITT